MGRARKPLKMQIEGKAFVCRAKHPLTGKVVRFKLGTAADAERNLEHLNSVFMHPERWEAVPDTVPLAIKEQWEGTGDGVRVKVGRAGNPDRDEVEALTAELEATQRELADAKARNRVLTRQLGQYVKRRFSDGPSPALADAQADYIEKYSVRRDANHCTQVRHDLARFVRHFGAKTPAESLEGRERDMVAWLDSLTTEKGSGDNKRTVAIGQYRRRDVRANVLKFLEAVGVGIDRKAIPTVRKADLRADRGAIRWLTKKQAQDVAKALPDYWKDVWKVQVGLGLRGDELPTLKAADFDEGCKVLTLSPLVHLTLKRGSRSVQVPAKVAKIIKRRLAKSEMVFPDERYGRPWASVELWDKKYRTALRKAAKAAGVRVPMDCRIGRKTCGSILLRSGVSVAGVASILGNSPAVVGEHYAAIISTEVNPAKAAL